MWALPSGQHTGPWHHEGHIKRPDTRPIEDPAEPPKITLAKQGASTHAPSGPTPQTWKLPFAKSTASMLISTMNASLAWFL